MTLILDFPGFESELHHLLAWDFEKVTRSLCVLVSSSVKWAALK